MLEGRYKSGLHDRIRKRLPGCIILKNDANYCQGIPDTIVLWENCWATLEVKRERPTASDFEPNQEWYIDRMNEMSFSACIFPENEEEVLDALQRSFQSSRRTRVSKSKSRSLA